MKASYPVSLVRLRLVCTGLCRTDIQAMTGQRQVSKGRILGHETAGVIEMIPPVLQSLAKEKGFQVGDRVAVWPFIPCGHCEVCSQGGPMEQCEAPSALGIDEDGAFSSTLDVPLSVLFKAPSALSWQQLAYAEPVAASLSVTEIPEIRTALRVGVLGHGRIAALTLKVINSVRSSLPPAILLDEVLLSKAASLRMDVVVETIATEDSMRQAAQSLKPGGLLIIKSRPSSSVPWPHQTMVLRRLRVQSAAYGSFQTGLDAMASGQLDVSSFLGPLLPFTYEGVKEALVLEARSETHGKIFFAVGGQDTSLPGLGVEKVSLL